MLTAGPATAVDLPFDSDESNPYLIIALKELNGNTDVATNNFELGANKAPVPANTSFINSGGGPSLDSSQPPIPSGTLPFFQGIDYSGNIAITDPQGEFELQDVGVYADPAIGIQVAAPNDSVNKSDNAFFNDPNQFPNTYIPAPGNPSGGTGVDVNPGAADQSTRIDADGSPGNVGVTYGVDFTDLLAELDNARTIINALPATGTLNTGGDGKIDSDTTLVLQPGLNVIDIDTGGNDFLVQDANLVIDGDDGDFVIFRLQGDDNMLISNANILASDGGIGDQGVLFYAGGSQNSGANFSFSNALLNGVAFWSLGNEGEINISNAQGCTQLVADIVDMDNVRLTRCAAPEPASAGVMTLLSAGLIARRRRA